jgi:hypothetical protein
LILILIAFINAQRMLLCQPSAVPTYSRQLKVLAEF